MIQSRIIQQILADLKGNGPVLLSAFPVCTRLKASKVPTAHHDNLGFGILLKGSSACSYGSQGFEPATFGLLYDPLILK